MFVIKSIISYEAKGRLAERSFHNEWSESIKSRVFGVTTALKIKGIFVGFTEFSDVERGVACPDKTHHTSETRPFHHPLRRTSQTATPRFKNRTGIWGPILEFSAWETR